MEREFERDLPEIKSYLMAFTTPGFKHRETGKGPMSLAYIRGKGAVEKSRGGLATFQQLATSDNDRPHGGVPKGTYVTGTEDLNKAADLLRKYG